MCARMAAVGAVPWRMTASDYLAALADATDQGLELPIDPHPSPATWWDDDLASAFNHDRLIVHEERLLHLLV